MASIAVRTEIASDWPTSASAQSSGPVSLVSVGTFTDTVDYGNSEVCHSQCILLTKSLQLTVDSLSEELHNQRQSICIVNQRQAVLQVLLDFYYTHRDTVKEADECDDLRSGENVLLEDSMDDSNEDPVLKDEASSQHKQKSASRQVHCKKRKLNDIESNILLEPRNDLESNTSLETRNELQPQTLLGTMDKLEPKTPFEARNALEPNAPLDQRNDLESETRNNSEPNILLETTSDLGPNTSILEKGDDFEIHTIASIKTEVIESSDNSILLRSSETSAENYTNMKVVLGKFTKVHKNSKRNKKEKKLSENKKKTCSSLKRKAPVTEYDVAELKDAMHRAPAKLEEVKEVDEEDENSDANTTLMYFRVGARSEYECRICGKRVQKKDHIITHVTTHSGKRPYQCDQCGKSYKRQSHLSRHSHVHREDTPSTVRNKNFKCDQCEAAFYCQSKLTEHKLIHTGEKPERCPHCEFETRRKKNLYRHLEAKHGTGTRRQHPCSQCDRVYLSRTSLKDHCLRAHEVHSPLMCEVCGKKFKTRPGLKEHYICHKDKVYSCRHCSFKTNRPKSFKLHEANHVLKTGQCEICGKGLSSLQALRKHLQAVHRPEADEVKSYSCKVCGVTYNNKQSMNSHMRKHKTPKNLSDGKIHSSMQDSSQSEPTVGSQSEPVAGSQISSSDSDQQEVSTVYSNVNDSFNQSDYSIANLVSLSQQFLHAKIPTNPQSTELLSETLN